MFQVKKESTGVIGKVWSSGDSAGLGLEMWEVFSYTLSFKNSGDAHLECCEILRPLCGGPLL